MRKVVSWLFISLDGVVEAPNEWQFDVMDDDMIAAITSVTEAEDSMLMGRVTYQDWLPFWPTSQPMGARAGPHSILFRRTLSTSWIRITAGS